jgi:ADP-ribosylglycohydrolase
MLLELAIGDAYGAGFEYEDRSKIERENYLTHYVKHSKWDIGDGKYTDDAQMSLAIAEMLVEEREWTPLNLANKFVEVFKRDERPGYAGGFYKFLQSVNNGEEFLEKIIPKSDKSGGAMRASPIGYLSNIKDVIDYSAIQAKLTHDTPIGINSSVASSLMTHYFLQDLGNKKNLGKFIESYVPGDWSEPWNDYVKSKGNEHVSAAITAVMEEDSLSEVLKRSIDFGGDVDTVATIAMAAASCSKEIEKDIPDNLINGLENDKFGRDYLNSLDIELEKKFWK